MALKKFEEYTKELNISNTSEKIKFSNLKNVQITKSNKINENSFLVGSDYKVKIVVDIPQSLVKEYIEKVKNETDKDPLDNFSEAEIAEQIVSFTIKQNLLIDNLTPDFTVGTENIGKSEKSEGSLDNDVEELSDDLGIDNTEDVDETEDDSDGDINFKDYNEKDDSDQTISDDEKSDNDGEIEFDDNTEETDLGEDRETDDSDPDSNFDEIQFDDNKNQNRPKTVGDLKNNINKKIETKHKQEEENSTEEEEEDIDDNDIEDMYKKIGYKVGYHEKMNLNLNYRKFNN